MGWLFTQGQTRKELIQRRIKREETENHIWETLSYCIRGNCLWRVVQYTNKEKGFCERFIALDLLSGDKEYGWGYKDMTEDMGPTQVNCPLSYLSMTGEPKEGYAVAWRERVKEYHKRMNTGKKFKIGQVVELKQGCTIPKVEIVSLKPLLGLYEGWKYRVNKALIKLD